MNHDSDLIRLERRLRLAADRLQSDCPPDLADRIVARLTAEPADRTGAERSEPAPRSRRSAYLAVAAVLLMAIGLRLYLAGTPPADRPTGTGETTSPRPAPPTTFVPPGLGLLFPVPTGSAAGNWQAAPSAVLDRELDRFCQDTAAAGNFIFRCLPLGSLRPTVNGG
jgi:hypothetical protein